MESRFLMRKNEKKSIFSLGPNGPILQIFLVVQYLVGSLKISSDGSNNLIFLDQVKRHCDLKTKRSIADEAYLWRSPVLCNIAINVKWFIWTSSPVIFWWVKKSLACLILAPTNVLTWYVKVTSAGVCKLGDFGCSVSLSANGKGPDIELAGTPGYQVKKYFRFNDVVIIEIFVPRPQSC